MGRDSSATRRARDGCQSDDDTAAISGVRIDLPPFWVDQMNATARRSRELAVSLPKINAPIGAE